jgi:type II secretory ATPase GspE/PulE/Tfp pilus assembly ATPase PilB-like protein
LCQDGHISSSVLKHQRDVRVGSGPTIYGERLVLRLMPDHTKYTALEELGFEPKQLDLLRKAIKSPSGMLLSVGPVGSGKSTTTYACLSLLNNPGRSLVTIEDPVERRIEGINQIQTDSKVGFGFVEALRGVLRQDPNVIMVGEIRDAETAHIAARAALTGTQVLSTLHAGDTAATVDLFREFELPPMFIADSLNCVIAQRLLRKVCTTDREKYHPDHATAQILGLSPEQCNSIELVRGIPSAANFNTGYLGRTGVFEIMPVDADTREAILHRKSNLEIRDLSRSKGMQTLEQSAANKVLAGITSIEEMHRVLLAG